MPKRIVPSRAFTLMELIVATSIAALMMWFVNVTFTHTQRSIHLGMAMGDSNVSSESLANQIKADAELMAGPGGPNAGILVIINKEYVNTIMPDPYRGRAGAEVPGQITRSDQLVWIAHDTAGPTFKSITPRDHDRMVNTLRAARARIWYGHVRITETNGQDGSFVAPADGTRAAQWVLGRQALLMGPDTSPPSSFTGADTRAQTYSAADERFGWNSVVDYQAGSTPWGVNPLLYRGVTDVLELGTSGYDPSVHFPPTSFPDEYLNAAYAFNDGTTDGRLRCNVNPAGNAGYGYWGWQMAQSHPHLMRNVSDFIVEFAADIVDDDSNGDPDGAPDRFDRPSDPEDGNIIWYSHYNLPDIAGNIDTISQKVSSSLATTNWRSTGSFASYEPYYAQSNGAQAMPAGYANADAAFVFQFDDADATYSKWPYLIRIRYRVHDDSGLMRSTDSFGEPTAGRWFEHIIKVNRP